LILFTYGEVEVVNKALTHHSFSVSAFYQGR